MRIRRVTYDLGNVIERQEYLDGRYGAPGEKRAKKKKATPEEVEQVKHSNWYYADRNILL